MFSDGWLWTTSHGGACRHRCYLFGVDRDFLLKCPLDPFANVDIGEKGWTTSGRQQLSELLLNDFSDDLAKIVTFSAELRVRQCEC